MRVVCLCCALCVPEIRPKKNCLHDTKNDPFYHLPVPTSRMGNSGFSCTPTSAFDGTHFALSRIRRPRIFPRSTPCRFLCVAQSCVHNGVCTSAVTWVCSLLYRLYTHCYHNNLLCVHITWKGECFKILKMSLFSVLPVPTRKMWNSTISCTPTSTLVGVQIFISRDRKVNKYVSRLCESVQEVRLLENVFFVVRVSFFEVMNHSTENITNIIAKTHNNTIHPLARSHWFS